MTKQITLEERKISIEVMDQNGITEEKEIDFNFCDQYLSIMRAPSPSSKEGVTPGEMEIRLAIIEKLKAAKDKKVVILEDTEHTLLRADVNASKFRIMDQAIVDLKKAVDNAEDVEIKEVKKKKAV
jgi:hypothetical protein|tara:strand:+ start:721 stop:1098 length:378 start_codon:yes stop_codon:yes gene_type:complete